MTVHPHHLNLEPHHHYSESDYQHLLDSMFVKTDVELWGRLRREIAHEHEIEELSNTTGINDKDLIEQLLSMGINSHNIAVLTMFPMVSVAYADGILGIEERDLILKIAGERNLKPGEPGFDVLNRWLKKGPSEHSFAAWQKYMRAVLQQMTPEQIADLKENIMTRATAVATAVGDVLGRFGDRTNKKEQARLAEIEATFQ
ncbi:hypothetical protein GC197_03810 [bacterium]|nr:hypothetical protein [bacterium]